MIGIVEKGLSDWEVANCQLYLFQEVLSGSFAGEMGDKAVGHIAGNSGP